MSKRVALLLALISMISMSVFAGAGSHDQKKCKAGDMDKMRVELNLTENQAPQVIEACKDYQGKVEAVQARMAAAHERAKNLKADGEMDAAALEASQAELKSLKAEKESLLKQHHEKIKTILTDEQFAKFQDLKGAHHGQGSEKHGRRSSEKHCGHH
ncbi:MAG: periplasmic heavy metal sensor [Acidobacteria bacterium]|nr:periplasmic heavy metal sensor [Acidobacteriota bacterium]MBI3658360.1 periplasmic heavy metal sensor [Acidobacteriota bacterium]